MSAGTSTVEYATVDHGQPAMHDAESDAVGSTLQDSIMLAAPARALPMIASRVVLTTGAALGVATVILARIGALAKQVVSPGNERIIGAGVTSVVVS